MISEFIIVGAVGDGWALGADLDKGTTELVCWKWVQ